MVSKQRDFRINCTRIALGEINSKYWELIKEFENITGVPVLLNTSFNENEPIVCTPEDAVNCFLRTEFDTLAIGDFLVTKK